MRKFSDICESVWMDIHKQSNGDSFKKEDQGVIDLMNEFIQRHNLKEGEYKINGNLTLDVYHDIQLEDDDRRENKIPFKFGKIDGDFRISNIPIYSLENSPNEVTGTYMITFTNIKTLEGSPRIVGKNFNVDFNRYLVTLDGSPDKVGGDYKFYSSWNVDDIKGISPEIEGNVIYSKENGTPKFSDEDFRKYSNIKGMIIRR